MINGGFEPFARFSENNICDIELRRLKTKWNEKKGNLKETIRPRSSDAISTKNFRKLRTVVNFLSTWE